MMASYKYLGMERRAASSLIVLVASGVLACSDALALQPLLPGTLPVAAANWLASGSATRSQIANQMTINQTTQRAKLVWDSFNVANGSGVTFKVPDSSSATLNVINDLSPSLIQGAVSSNGQLYMVNHNGIIFDKGAQVNVHTLIASTLDISDAAWNNGIGSITDGSAVFAGGSIPDGLVRVEDGAQLTSLSGGKIMLFAPKVENNGVITTPDGQTILAAGSKVYLTSIGSSNPDRLENGSPLANNLRGLLVEVDSGGTATNLGKIVAERGNVTLIGLTVNQQGRISATTSINENGTIRLLARDTVIKDNSDANRGILVKATHSGTVTLASGSVTEVLPDLTDKATSPDVQKFNPSMVEIMGNKINMLANSQIVVPGGQVILNALQDPHQATPFKLLASVQGSATNDSRVYMEGSSSIDVSGTRNVDVKIERNIVQVELFGSVLKDSPLQESGPLRGKKINVDITKGTPLGDYSGNEAGIGRTVAERTAAGGTVKIASEGDIIVGQGATVNLSGGSLKYSDGYLNPTKLVAQGKIVDISEASPDRIYDGIAGTLTRDHAKWAVKEAWIAPLSRGRLTQGYMEGKNAGTLQFIAPSMVMDGTVIGKTTAGIYQRQPYSADLASAPYKTLHNLMPNGATMIVGDDSQVTIQSDKVELKDGVPQPDFKISSVSFVSQSSPLPNNFNTNSVLPKDRAAQVQLAAGLMGKDAVANLSVYSNDKIDLPSGLTLEAPGGNVKLIGSEVNVAGNIDIQSGNITLTSLNTFGRPVVTTSVAVSGNLNASGGWVNDDAAIHTGRSVADPILIKGGKVTISANGDALLAGSTFDVSGGGWVDANGALSGKGDAGSISIVSGAGFKEKFTNTSVLTLGNLYGYALGKGGSLSLTTGKVKIGDTGQAGELALPASFFSQGGFSTIKVDGTDGLNIAASTAIQAKAQSQVINPKYRVTSTGRSMASVSYQELLADSLRKPGNLTFSASSKLYGNLVMQKGGAIAVDAGGSINLSAGRQLSVDGTLIAPAGSIGLTMLGAPGGDTDSYGFLPDQSIWLGKNAQLLSRGFDATIVKDNGMHQGEILDGGQVSIFANKGYVVTEAGSLIDVSGSGGIVDVLSSAGGRSSYQRMVVPSNAGSINIVASEGALLDGGMTGKAGGAGVQGGTFSLQVDGRGKISEFFQPTQSSVLPYPVVDRQVVVSQKSGFVPAGLKAGDAIDTSYNGQGKVAADSLMTGGFDQVALKAKDAVLFDGDVTLKTARSIQLDAPNIVASSGKKISLSSGYVSIANTEPKYQTLPNAQGGTANLNVAAQWIDLTGKVALNGFGQTVLTSSGDIRLKGVKSYVSTDFFMKGSFTTAGDLEMRARQIYPATLSEYAIAITDHPAGTLHIAANGSDTPVLSAAGKLTMSAPNIVQEGVIKAPLGEITLAADNRLTLGSASITSVSAEGQLIPFGTTSNGKDWQYALDASTKITITPNPDGSKLYEVMSPEKRITLNGNDIKINNGAKVDLSGGGDLYAYEFIPGAPGRSVDILDSSYSTNSYAVIPGLKSNFAPYDTQYSTGTTLKPGDSVYLSGANGLAAGVYTLLPAHYALLPGAFLVQSVNGYRDMQPQQKVLMADGTQIVAGYRTVTDRLNDAARYSGFSIRPGADIKKEAEYQQSTASQFFARQALTNGTSVPRLPMDAGHLVLAPRNTLAMQGDSFKTGHDGGRGALVDIDASKLFVGEASAAPNGYVSIDAATLTGMNAESLLLGGSRKTVSDGQQITVDSTQIVVANDANHALKAPEIIIAAKDKITVNAGSDIEASGIAGSSQDLIIGRGGNGDGALLRVAAGDHDEVKRENVHSLSGTLEVGSNVLLGGKSITLDATLETTSRASLQLAGGSLALGAGHISLGDASGVTSGIVLSNNDLAALGSLDGLYLKSYNTIDFYGNVNLGAGLSSIQYLALDAGGLRGFGNSGNATTLVATDVVLHNSNTVNTDSATGIGSTLKIQGQKNIIIAEGSQHVSGFGSVNLAVAGGDISGQGTGSLKLDGDLNLQAARITAGSGSVQNWTAIGKVQVSPSTTASTQAAPIGGKLAISGQRILNQGNIELAAGTLTLAATGSGADDNVTLATGSKTSAAGIAKNFAGTNVFAPGGLVKLASTGGNVDIQSGATVDVSGATGGGDAGTLQTSAVKGQVLLSGELKGGADSGAVQGIYTQDAKTLPSFSALNNALEAGKFNELRDIRIRQGNVEIAAGDLAHAHQFSLAADAGKVDVSGQVDASGTKGGQIRIAASGDVTIHNGGSLQANSTAGKGGTVELSTTSGMLSVEDGSQIGVGGVSGNASVDGGQVVLRASRTAGNNVAIALGRGVIGGARGVIAEAVKVYDGISSVGTTTGSGKLNINTVKTETTNFMANAATVEARLGNNAKLRAGIEVRSAGDIALVNDWDLSSWHVGGRPIMLTMRATGDLNINSNLSDGFSSAATTATLGSGASAFYRLVSGADMSAANPLANKALDTLASGKGNLKLASGKLVRTGTGNIELAAGRDLILASDSSVIYTAGEKAASLGVDENGKELFAGNYALNGGNIKLNAQRDIVGATTTQLITEWLQRDAKTRIDKVDNTYKTSWWIQYDKFKQGVGALGGGNVGVLAGGNVSNLGAVIPTTGRVGVIPKAVLETRYVDYIDGDGMPQTVQVDTRKVLVDEPRIVAPLTVLGGGDLKVQAGGDILSGVFYVERGAGNLTAKGSIKESVEKSKNSLHTILALGDGSFKLTAGGDLQVETVLNPTVIMQGTSQTSVPAFNQSFFFTYAPESSVEMTALTGKAQLYNGSQNIIKDTGLTIPDSNKIALVTYPGSVRLAALSSDVEIMNSFSLFPSAHGNLEILAQGSVKLNGGTAINLSDADPMLLPNVMTPLLQRFSSASNMFTVLGSNQASAYAATPVHTGDTNPVLIVAKDGDISANTLETVSTSWLYLSKAAHLEAGRDISNVSLLGQNLAETDVTSIHAGRDIFYDTPRDATNGLIQNDKTIQLSGPGRLDLLAGRNIDLSNLVGVVTKGNTINPALPDKGADIAVTVGVNGSPDYSGFAAKYGLKGVSGYTPELAQTFFKQLVQAGIEHNAGKDGSVDSSGQAMGYQRGYDAIARLFPNSGYKGDLNLFFSQIKTERGGNIDLFVPGGKIFAGLASIPADLIGSKLDGPTDTLASKLGVVTAKGGSVRSMSKGDFLVNSSRVFTLQGGDIVLWSSEGDIDAGKGAKTALAVPPPIIKTDPKTGVTTTEYQGAATGSGIRVLLTGDAVAGEVDLIAPRGAVIAGDAGIGSAGNINIAAQVVRGADNINFSGTSSGVPVANTSSLAAGLTGVSGQAADAGKAGADAIQAMAQQKPQENFRPAFLNVEVIGLGE